MKWRIWPNPKVGDTRNLAKFAWLPTRVEQWLVWLMPYRVRERYSSKRGDWGFEVFEWIEVGRWL